MLYIWCHMSGVTCQVSGVTCQVSHVTSNSQIVRARERKFWENVHLLSPVNFQVSCVTCHVSCVTCHLSQVTCHMSPITCHLKKYITILFFWEKVVRLVGVGYVINGAYPVQIIDKSVCRTVLSTYGEKIIYSFLCRFGLNVFLLASTAVASSSTSHFRGNCFTCIKFNYYIKLIHC